MKRTFQPSLVSKKRKQGFLIKLSTRNGKLILLRRRKKGRKILTK